MATKNDGSQATNLASLLLIKQKMAAKDNANSGTKQGPSQPPLNATVSHSNDRLTYHQNLPVAAPTNNNEQSKLSRKTKGLEVALLDKKLDEINRKQEAKTNETIDTWKSFDTVNYRLGPQSQSTPVPPPSAKQNTALPASPVKTTEKPVAKPLKQEPLVKQQSTEKRRTPTPKKTSAKRAKSADKDRSRSKSPLKNEEPRKKSPVQQKTTEIKPPPPQSPKKTSEKQPTPPPQKKPTEQQPSDTRPPREKSIEKQPTPPPRRKTIEKQPSSPLPAAKDDNVEKRSPLPPRQKSTENQPPTPLPRRSKINSALSLKKAKSHDYVEQSSKSPTPVIENVIPISAVLFNPQKLKQNVQPFEPSFNPTVVSPNYKLFPDTKPREVTITRNACKSIQRSMDRYRFHVW